MLRELLIKFVLGGLSVSVFAVIGEVWKPKTFSGIFGAVPSVARAHWPSDVIAGGLLGLTAASAGRLLVGLPRRS